MCSSSLLAQLTKNFGPHLENVATEALGHILAHSASAGNGLTPILSGTGIFENLSYRTQQAEGARHTLRPVMERQTRADMHDKPSHEAVNKEIAYLTVSNRSLFNENCAVYEMHSRFCLQQL